MKWSSNSCFKLTWPVIIATTLAATGLTGCVSKAKARAEANAAFVAGQQQAMARMQASQSQPGMVRINGQVRQPVLPWTEKMTLSSALVAADYFGAEPTSIYIVRNGRPMQVDPKSLLSGNDVQILSGDVIQINSGPVTGPPAQAPPR